MENTAPVLPTQAEDTQEPQLLAEQPEVDEGGPEDHLDGSVDSLTDFTHSPQDMGVPPTDGQLEGAAEQYNMATVTNSRHITPEDVLDMVRRDITPYDVDNVLRGIQSQSPAYRQAVAYNLLGDDRLQVESKLQLLRYVDAVGREKDVNYVTKQAQVNASAADYQNDDEPDAPKAHAMQVEKVAMQGARVEKPEYTPEHVYGELNALYQEADSKESFLDYAEQMTPVGSLPTLNKVVANIYHDLGIDTASYDKARPWLTVGNAFVELRTMVRQASPEMRENIARVVLKNLKQNTGIFQDHNDLVTMQVIGNLFSKELFGTDPYAAEVPLSDQEKAGLDQQIASIEKQYKAAVGNSQERARLQSELETLKMRQHGIPNLSTFGDDVFNLLDVTAVGGLAKGLGKTIRSLPKLLEGLSHTAPETAARKAAEGVLDESGQAAAKLGATPLDLADNFLASGADDAVINRGVNGFAAMDAQMQAQARAVVRTVQPTNLTAVEREKALADITSRYSPEILTKNRAVKQHLNQATVQTTEDGTSAAITAVFGATPYRGYATVQAAKNASLSAIEEVFGKDAPIEIISKGADGKWKVLEEGAKAKDRGEFFLRVRDIRHAASSETYGTIQLADDAMDKLTLSNGASHWTRGLNVFNDFHYDQISARVRESSFSKATWQGLMEPLARLKTSDKQMLSKIIRENEGKELMDEEVGLLSGENKAVMDGYRRFIHIGNIAYHIEDSLKRTAYLREGLSDLYQNGSRIGFGRVLDELSASASRRKVFDPALGKYSTMNQGDIEALYKRGGSLAKLKHPIRGSENIEDALVVIDPRNKGKVLPIPVSGVQPRIPGYYPHMYSKNFIVYGVDKAGKRIPKAISFTHQSAADYVERQNAKLAVAQSKGKAKNLQRYEMGFDPSLSKGELYAQHLDELESGFSQIMFGERSNRALRQLDSAIEEAELDPLAAMLRATEVLSTRVTKGEMLQSMRQRVWNSLHTPEGKQYLKAGAEKKSYNQLSVDDLVEAHPNKEGLALRKSMLYRIRLMEQSPDFWESQTKAAYRSMAQLSQKLGLKGMEAAAYRGAKTGAQPIQLGLGWMHRMYISAFATKQLVLQTLQSTATAGMLSPAQYTKSVWQAGSILPAVLTRTGNLHGGRITGWLENMLQPGDWFHSSSGLSKKEWNRLVDVIIERGLIDSIGANTMVKAAIGDAADAAARARAGLPRKGVPEAIEAVRDSLGPLAPLTRVRTYDQAIFGTLNKLGWEGGERINQVLSMLTLYNRDKAKGVARIFDEAYVDSLIGRTAELTGNMVKEAGFGYTNSVLKPFMLWVPFQHKMILQALPKRIGGMQRFTAWEKTRMVLGQFLLYGANATAITAAVHQAIERQVVERLEARKDGDKNAFVQAWRSTLATDMLEGMVFDWMGNKTMQALWGEGDTPYDMAWGRAFAPGAGHEFVREKITALATGDWNGALSVQGNYASKLTRYLADVSHIANAQMNKMDDVPIGERMQQMTQRGLVDLVPIYGKGVVARWALAHGQYISENGVLSEPFGNDIEVKLQYLLGVDSKDRESYYAAVDRLRMDFEDEKKADGYGEEVADIYWKNLVTTAVKLDEQAPTDEMYDQMLNQWTLDQGLMLSVLGAREKEKFNARIQNKLDELALGVGDSAELAMMDRLTNKLKDGGFGDKGPTAAVYFRHLPFVEKNPVFLDMIEEAWNDIVNEPEPQNITEDALSGDVE